MALAMTTCPWNKITRQSIPGRTGVQAQARWSEALDPQVKKGKWSPEEDALLLKGVQESHKCWIWIADGIPGRTQRQCRTRWVQISTRAEREAAAAAIALAKSQARGLEWGHAPL
ncbi:Myblike DNAbinding domain-containing protein [Mortierella alpina]|nr:Myblike DNAbinding domain-containing protein [Mortierella alpina]